MIRRRVNDADINQYIVHTFVRSISSVYHVWQLVRSPQRNCHKHDSGYSFHVVVNIPAWCFDMAFVAVTICRPSLAKVWKVLLRRFLYLSHNCNSDEEDQRFFSPTRHIQQISYSILKKCRYGRHKIRVDDNTIKKTNILELFWFHVILSKGAEIRIEKSKSNKNIIQYSSRNHEYKGKHIKT